MFELEKLRNIFPRYENIKAAYLFGSYAEGRQNRNSDLDIAVLLDEGYDKMIKLDILSKLVQINIDNVDLIILNNASILAKYETVKHNNIIYCRDDFVSSEYYSKIIRLFLDFRPYLEVQRMYLKERIING